MLPIASIYERMGYNILLPDLHAHGLSDGNDIQMGWKDRKDIIRWIYVARGMFRSTKYQPRMVLHGVSMGAATVMNVSGENLPDGICCFVEDLRLHRVCGTSSAVSSATSSICPIFLCFMWQACSASCATAGRSARRLRSVSWASSARLCSISTARLTIMCRRQWCFRSTT